MRVMVRASVALLAVLICLPTMGAAASPDPSPSPGASVVAGSPAPASPAAAVPGLVLAPGSRIGADPPLRDPVQPTGRVLVPDTDRTADLDEALRPVRMQIWFPEGTGGPGDTLRVHVRITNQGCCPTDPCRGSDVVGGHTGTGGVTMPAGIRASSVMLWRFACKTTVERGLVGVGVVRDHRAPSRAAGRERLGAPLGSATIRRLGQRAR